MFSPTNPTFVKKLSGSHNDYLYDFIKQFALSETPVHPPQTPPPTPPPTFIYLFTVSYICVCSRSLLFFLIYLINITAISIQSFFFYNTAGYPPVTDYRASRASMQ